MFHITRPRLTPCRSAATQLTCGAARRELMHPVMCYPKKHAYLSSATMLRKSASNFTVGAGPYLRHFKSDRCQKIFQHVSDFTKVAFATGVSIFFEKSRQCGRISKISTLWPSILYPRSSSFRMCIGGRRSFKKAAISFSHFLISNSLIAMKAH